MSINLAGTGSKIPERIVSNEEVVKAMGEKSPSWIKRLLDIEERRFFVPISSDSGTPEKMVDETKIAAQAGKQALQTADIEPEDVDRLIYVTCTQDYPQYGHFALASMEVLKNIGLRKSTAVTEIDAGCGGFVTALNDATKLLTGSGEEVSLIVTSHITSKFYDRHLYAEASDAWLTGYVFGDGAGAVVLQQADNSRGVLDTYTAVDPDNPLIDFYYPDSTNEPVYKIMQSVKAMYSSYMQEAIDGVAQKQFPRENRSTARECLLNDIDWLFAHQANKVLLDNLVDELRIDPSTVPVNVDTHGNLSAATLSVLLHQTKEVKKGDLCLFAAVGAGAQIAGALVRI